MEESTTSWFENVTSSGMEVVDLRPPWIIVLGHVNTIVNTFNVVILMLGMGAATYVKELWDHMKKPWGCLIGLVCQFIILPAVGFGLCLSLQLDPYQALGVLILTCSPGGAFSNFFTFWVDGDLALSIMMTAISAMVAFGAMPFNLWAYTQRWTSEELRVPYLSILLSLALVAFPAIVGMAIRHKSKRIGEVIKKVCGVLGWLLVLACAVMLLLIYWRVLITADLRLLAAAALLPFCGCLIAYTVAKCMCFSHRVSRTIGIETGCQNMVVATNIMLISFPDHLIQVRLITFPLLYGVCQLCMIFVFIIAFHLWRRYRGGGDTDDDADGVVMRWKVEERVPDSPTTPTTPLTPSFRTSVPVPAHLSPASYKKMYNNDPFESDALLASNRPDTNGEESTAHHAQSTFTFFPNLTQPNLT